MTAEHVRAIQRDYPQIYLACHTRHQRAASSEHGLSEHDSSVLAHLDERVAMTAATLARHLRIGPPTLSATLGRLTALGYIARTPTEGDRRVTALRLSKAGVLAMQASSVLDSSRVEALLDRLSPGEQRRAVDGLALLARAAREMAMSEGDTGVRDRPSRRPRAPGAVAAGAASSTARSPGPAGTSSTPERPTTTLPVMPPTTAPVRPSSPRRRR